MAVSKKVEALTEMLAPSLAAVGFELWGVDFFQQGRHSVLRLYIDGPEGVGVDDRAAVSHQVRVPPAETIGQGTPAPSMAATAANRSSIAARCLTVRRATSSSSEQWPS